MWGLSRDASLAEATESYEVEIWAAGFTTLKRTIATTTTSASYTAAQQTTDFGGPQSAVSTRIYQLSATVGRGFPVQAVL